MSNLINESFNVQAQGQPFESQTTMLKMQKMLAIAGWEASTGEFFRRYREDERFANAGDLQPSTGHTLYRAIRDYFNITEGSIKDRLIFLAGLPSSRVTEVIENTFVPYGFYNFKAYTGIARDLYGL